MREAPLYVRGYDLMHFLFERTRSFPKHQRFVLASRIQDAVFDLVEHISIALLEPEERAASLRCADIALTRLRIAVRLADDLTLLCRGHVAHVHQEMTEIGKMLGGWRRKVSPTHAGPPW